jgi:glyoxylase-like metal-dependent hydrolase (beta-lactamase superfamily II)
MTNPNKEHPEVAGFFDPGTWTVTYVVHQGVGSDCVIIDSVLDYDAKSGRTTTASADQVVAYVRQNQLRVQWILETHAHADHLTAAPYLRQLLGGKIGIGRPITQVQKVFKGIFNLEKSFCEDGSQFDALFDDGETLYASIQKLLSLPGETRLFMCHDYPPDNRAVRFETTVAEQRQSNIHVHDGVSEDQFVKMRSERDAGLAMPTLLLPSIQVNIRAGELPPAEANGTAYLKIPLNAL